VSNLLPLATSSRSAVMNNRRAAVRSPASRSISPRLCIASATSSDVSVVSWGIGSANPYFTVVGSRPDGANPHDEVSERNGRLRIRHHSQGCPELTRRVLSLTERAQHSR
jgi:hypothetical protein